MDWLNAEIIALTVTAVSVGVLHTLLGPDHYLPFVALARSRGWKLARTLRITLLCGLGHVGGSVALGLIGIMLGQALFQLEVIESLRGQIAAWCLLAFGLVYCAWGLRAASGRHGHSHWHAHADGSVHLHTHVHRADHAHPHDRPGLGRRRSKVTPWAMFVIFVLGPCEALIPLLMYPAARQNYAGLGLVAATFALATLATMVAMVTIGIWGSSRVAGRGLERYSHAVAGGVISLCGVAVLLGL